ncbi:Conserved_hypothetical protein [Hexamita inflata]|uniref:Uncharacterized protein n=1 Tax=Hexamita inflata TaxID=28002 RepID=A0AA86PM87_9EUKA|nr:Conserved hypothetical protein [Hexamita inflata]
MLYLLQYFGLTLQTSCLTNEYYDSTSSQCVSCGVLVVTLDQTACVCPMINMLWDSISKSCICDTSSYNYSTVDSWQCIRCENGALPKSDKSACDCVVGYDNVQRRCCSPANEYYLNNICVQCPTGAILTTIGSLTTCDCQLSGSSFDRARGVCHCQSTLQYYSAGACYSCTLNTNLGTLALVNSYFTGCQCSDLNKIFVYPGCVCPNSFYEYNSICVFCPSDANLNKVGNTCTCINANFEFSISQNQCVCTSGYYLYLGQCLTCPIGSTLIGNTCDCGVGKQMNYSTMTCQCASNYYLNGANCVQCPTSSVVSPDLSTCLCPTNYIFDGSNCICDSNSVLHSGVCQQCPADSNKITTSCTCQDLSATYDIASNQCKCSGSNMYKLNNICTLCPNDATASQDLSTCVCNNIQAHFYNGVCSLCPDHSSWNKVTKLCECASGSTFNSSNVCVCNDASKSWFNNQCMVCPQYSSVSNGICVCDSGYQQALSICVIHAIKTQVPIIARMNLISLPTGSSRQYLCYYQHKIGGYTYIENSLDYRSCPANSRYSFFVEGERMQKNMIHMNVYFNAGSEFIGILGGFQPKIEVSDLQYHIGIFADSLNYMSVISSRTLNLTMESCNISILFGNQTALLDGLVYADVIYMNLVTYSIYAPSQSGVFISNMSNQVYINDSAISVNISAVSNMSAINFMNGKCEFYNSNISGLLQAANSSALVLVIGANSAASLLLDNVTIALDYSKSTAFSGLLAGNVYMADLSFKRVKISGQRLDNNLGLLIGTKQFSLTNIVLNAVSQCVNGSVTVCASGCSGSVARSC